MAGYVLKIMIEDTHPPVWRRVVVPERITFYDLHLVIQILFGWDDCHLHEFCIPSKNIVIVSDSDLKPWGDCYPEEETLIEQFLPRTKSMRYTYDFGDEWRHKIIFERKDAEYTDRTAALLKAKGNNFEEDSGGIWGYDGTEEDRPVFDAIQTADRLRQLRFSTHENLDVHDDPTDYADEQDKWENEFLDHMLARMRRVSRGIPDTVKPSKMEVKIDQWEEFQEDFLDSQQPSAEEEDVPEEYSQMVLPFVSEEDLRDSRYILETVPGAETCRELLRGLDLREARDYCVYLLLPERDARTRNQMTDAVAQEFYRHPEYLLYVLDKEELEEYLHMAGLPYGRQKEISESDMITKALSLGLADVSFQRRKGQTRATVMFASDIPPLLTSMPAKLRKQTYRDLKKFDDRLLDVLIVYGMMDFDSLHDLFLRVYHMVIDPETFHRYICWHADFNDLIQTAYFEDNGKYYAASPNLDYLSIITKMRKYAKDRSYLPYSAQQLREMADNPVMRSEGVGITCDVLHYVMGLSVTVTTCILNLIFPEILEGCSLPECIRHVVRILSEKPNLGGMCDLWYALSSLLLDLGLPMLKGRSREMYAMEENISPWEIDMLESEPVSDNTRERHMYEFDPAIQEMMHNAQVNSSNIDVLWDYRKRENVLSEEYLYLLAEACLNDDQYHKAELLILRLEKSSPRGKQGAEELRQFLDDFKADNADDFPFLRENRLPPVPQPYVRETPKIGRNDPCPCGSGKKYKHCCGKNR